MNRVQTVSAGVPICQGSSFSETIMAIMTRGKMDELEIELNDTMSTDDADE